MATPQFHPTPPVVASVPQAGGDPVAVEVDYNWEEFPWGTIGGCSYRIEFHPRNNYEASQVRWKDWYGRQQTHTVPSGEENYTIDPGWGFLEPTDGAVDETIVSGVEVVYREVQPYHSGLVLRDASTNVILRRASTGVILRDA